MTVTCPKCTAPHVGPVNLARHGVKPHGDFDCEGCGWKASLELTEAEYAELLGGNADAPAAAKRARKRTAE